MVRTHSIPMLAFAALLLGVTAVAGVRTGGILLFSALVGSPALGGDR